jgi:hypothetical protein
MLFICYTLIDSSFYFTQENERKKKKSPSSKICFWSRMPTRKKYPQQSITKIWSVLAWGSGVISSSKTVDHLNTFYVFSEGSLPPKNLFFSSLLINIPIELFPDWMKFQGFTFTQNRKKSARISLYNMRAARRSLSDNGRYTLKDARNSVFVPRNDALTK